MCILSFNLFFFQAVVKTITFVVFHDGFKKIEIDRKNFWKLECLGTQVETEIKTFRRYALTGFRIYLVTVSLTLIALVVKSIYFREMPFPCWCPEGWKTKIIVYQIVTLPYPIFIVAVFDLLYSASYIEAYFQFKLLNCAFSRLQTVEDIKKCHIHQHFLFQ